MSIDVDAILAQDDDAFAAHCRVHAYRTGGPGGQKRNKTSSAIEATHTPTGVLAHCAEFRSQADNRRRALHRLRFRIAAEIRSSVLLRGYAPPAWLKPYTAGRRLQVNHANPQCARVGAHVLDVIAATDGNVQRSAALLGVSTSSLYKWLRQESRIWDAYVAIRRTNGLSADPFG